MWKELREINEMFTPINERQVIDDSDVVRYQKIRVAKQHFNLLIEKYIKKDHSLFSTINYTYNLNYEKEIENFNPDNFKDYQTIPIENNN